MDSCKLEGELSLFCKFLKLELFIVILLEESLILRS